MKEFNMKTSFLERAIRASAVAMAGLSCAGVSQALEIYSPAATVNPTDQINVSAAVQWRNVFTLNGQTFYNANEPLGSRTITATLTPKVVRTTAISNVKPLELVNGRYEAKFTDLPPARYSAELNARRTLITSLGGTPAQLTSTTTTDQETISAIDIRQPRGCFSFEKPTDTEGWTTEGFFESAASGNPGVTIYAPINFQNRLFVGIGAAQALNTDFVGFDLKSPDLTANDNWKDLHGVSYVMQSNAEAHIVPYILVRAHDGTNVKRVNLNAQGGPLFLTHDVGPTNVGVSDIQLEKGDVVVAVKLRVWLRRTSIGSPSDSFFSIDSICPR
jgi:hypothetical protein